MKSARLFTVPCFAIILFFLIFPIVEIFPNEDDFFDEFDNYFFEAPGLIIEASTTTVYRSMRDIFPGISNANRNRAMSSFGLRHSFDKDGGPILIPGPNSGINLLGTVARKNPSHIIEACVVVPYTERGLDLVDIYNALGRIEKLKDQGTTMRNGDVVYIFKDTTRLDTPQRRRAISDPPPANIFPASETMYLRFTDAYIGDVFLRGEISINAHGMIYNLTNFRDINFSIFRIMRAERVSVILYIEPVREGILIYSVSGIFLPDFIIGRVNLTPNINIRITSLLNWISEGLKIQESLPPVTARDVIQNEQFNRLLHN